MTLVAYRATVYAPRSVDATEATVLTPASGAPHSDEFKVTTLAVSGFQPYLFSVSGREGKLDPLACHTDVGEIVLTLADAKSTSTSTQLEGWVTAYVGDVNGLHRLAGCKVKIEQSTDGGTTWTTYFTGRLGKARLLGLARYEFPVRDMSKELSARCFVGRPHSSITYASLMSQCPVGSPIDYGDIPAVTPLTGTIGVWRTTQAGATVFPCIALDPASAGRSDNLATAAIGRALGVDLPDHSGAAPGYPNFASRLRAYVVNLDSPASGVFRVGSVATAHYDNADQSPLSRRIVRIAIQALDASDPDYLAVPSASTNVSVYLYLDDVVSPSNPLLIDDVHVATLARDLLDGKFSPVYQSGQTLPSGMGIGDVVFSFGHQDADDAAGRSGFTDFIADATLPTLRFVITEPQQIARFIEEQLFRPFRLALRLQPDGKAIPLDLRMPTSLPATTIPNAALAEAAVGWEQDPDDGIWAIQARRYEEHPEITVWTTGNFAGGVRTERVITFPKNVSEFVEASPVDTAILYLGSLDVGDAPLKLDCRGLRSMPGETLNGQLRSVWADRVIETFARHLAPSHGRGPTWISVVADASHAAVSDCQLGDRRLITLDPVPDPSTHRRGGTRVGLCCGRAMPAGFSGKVALRFLDLGVNVVATAPTVGTPSATAADPHHSMDIAVTLNASSERAAVHLALTSTSVGTRPADDSALWVHVAHATSSTTIAVPRLPSGMRAWVRVRTEAEPEGVLPPKLPSAWAYPGGTGYGTTTAYTAPSSLAVPSPSGNYADCTFTPGNTTLRTKVYLVTPTSDPLEHILTLPPGSTGFRLTNLETSTQYKVAVAHMDGVGGETAADDETFTTSGTPNSCPSAGYIGLVAGTL